MRSHHSRTDDDVQLRHSTGARRPRITEDQIRAVYRFMYRHVGNRGDAESLTEWTCSEALRAALDLADEHDEPDEQTLGELLWRTADAVVTEHLHWFYGSPAALAEEPALDEPTDAPAQVREILAQLPAQAHDFLAHRFLANASLEEAADALRMTRSDAQELQWRALIQAARILRPEKACSTC